jgi:gas vesicle protein
MTARQFINKRSVSTLFLGGLIGAGTALLIAPTAGKDTRRKIRHYAGEVTYKGGDYFRQGKNMMASAFEKGANYIDSGKNLISSSLEAGKKAYLRERERLTH